jgi:hypothetical protein
MFMPRSFSQLFSASSSWYEYWVLPFIILVAFTVRLKGITNQPTDWHAFRQADTASVTREYVKHGIDLLYPRYQDLGNIQSGKENPEGYRMVEFPIINALIALILRAWPSLDLVIVSRLVSILFSLGTLVAIYYLGKTWSGAGVGLVAALVFAVLPYGVFYTRAILPEPFFLTFSTTSILFFQWWVNEKRLKWYSLSLVSLAIALLLKPIAIFLGPVYALLAWQAFGWRMIKRWELVPFVVGAFTPLILWRRWIAHYPEGIPAFTWLLNGDPEPDKSLLYNWFTKPTGTRLKPFWFRWLFWERMTKLIAGYVGVFFMAFGLGRLELRSSSWWKYLAWWVSILLYFLVIATGNVRHDYYQVIVIPIVSLTMALGLVWLGNIIRTVKTPLIQLILATLLVVSFVRMIAYADSFVAGYYSTRPDWEKAGRIADQVLPVNAKVIAPAFGDTAFLFQTNRTGWPIGYDIDKKIAAGATHYVTTSYDDEARELEAQYETVIKVPEVLILDLRKPRQ